MSFLILNTVPHIWKCQCNQNNQDENDIFLSIYLFQQKIDSIQRRIGFMLLFSLWLIFPLVPNHLHSLNDRFVSILLSYINIFKNSPRVISDSLYIFIFTKLEIVVHALKTIKMYGNLYLSSYSYFFQIMHHKIFNGPLMMFDQRMIIGPDFLFFLDMWSP